MINEPETGKASGRGSDGSRRRPAEPNGDPAAFGTDATATGLGGRIDRRGAEAGGDRDRDRDRDGDTDEFAGGSP